MLTGAIRCNNLADYSSFLGDPEEHRAIFVLGCFASVQPRPTAPHAQKLKYFKLSASEFTCHKH